MRKNPPIPSENLNDLHDIMTLMTYHFFARKVRVFQTFSYLCNQNRNHNIIRTVMKRNQSSILHRAALTLLMAIMTTATCHTGVRILCDCLKVS